MNRYTDRLKIKWGIDGTRDFLLILMVFALSGYTAVYCSRYVNSFLGFGAETHTAVKITVKILLFMPLYQVLTVMYSVLLGQFKFFWPKQKLLGRLMLRVVTFNRINAKF